MRDAKRRERIRRRRFEDDLPLQQRLLRATRLRGGHQHGARLRRTPAAAVPAATTPVPAAQGYIRLADTSLRGTRHPVPARPAGRPEDRRSGRRASASPGSPTAVARASSSPTCGTASGSPDGSLRAVDEARSGNPLSITAAWPRWPWSDLVDSLLPNGRFLDTPGGAGRARAYDPVGDPSSKATSTGLYADSARAAATTAATRRRAYCARTAMPTYDADFALVNAGEPASDEAKARLAEIYAHHQAYGIPGTPAPLLLENGWTDDLLPARAGDSRSTTRRRASSPVSLQFGDLGHSRGSNKPTVNHVIQRPGCRVLRPPTCAASRGGPAPREVTAFTQTCPASANRTGGPTCGPPSTANFNTGTLSFGGSATQARDRRPAIRRPARRSIRSPGPTMPARPFPRRPLAGTATYNHSHSLGLHAAWPADSPRDHPDAPGTSASSTRCCSMSRPTGASG